MTTHPMADGDGWITHTGGPQPVADGTIVDVRFANGRKNSLCPAAAWAWEYKGEPDDYLIVAYRILSPADPPSAPVADPAAEIVALKAEVADWRERVGKLHENIEAWTEDAANHLARAMKAEAEVARLREALGKAATDLEAIGGCPQTDVGLARFAARTAATVARAALQPKDPDHG